MTVPSEDPTGGTTQARSVLECARVLDLSRFIAGPFCAQILGDLGADVIKVEPVGGEPARRISPIVEGESLYFVVYNRSKRGVTLNFRDPRGQRLLRDLLSKTDVFIENFRPGVLEKMGLDDDILASEYPRLIHATVLGFGREGPYANLPCFDEISQAMGGLMSICGYPDGPPTLPGTYVSDISSGLYLAVGILSALMERERSGKGQKVDVALFDSVISFLHTGFLEYKLLNRTLSRTGNQNRGIAPGNAYKAQDGFIVIEAITQGMWENLVGLMERPELLEDPSFSSPVDRRQHADEVDTVVAEWVSRFTVDDLFERLSRAGVASGPVQDVADLWADAQVQANDQIKFVHHQKLGEIPLSANVIKLEQTPTEIRRAPPTLGEHNDEVYGDLLGLSAASIDALRRQGVI